MRQVLLLIVLFASGQSDRIDQIFITSFAKAQLNISEKCSKQLNEFLQNLGAEDSWALQMLDATSKIPAGLLSLNLGDMGNFHQCIQIQTHNTNSGQILGKYCLGSIIPTNESSGVIGRQIRNSLGDLAHMGSYQSIVWSLCVPDGCSTQDVNQIGNYIFNVVVGPDLTIDFQDFLCQTSKNANEKLTPGAILAIIILALLLLMVVISTLYDVYSSLYRKRYYEPLTIFSLYTNGKKVFKMTPPSHDQLHCLNGLKFCSMIWVVLGHQYSIVASGPLTNSLDLLKWANSWYSMFIVSGTLSVDTFLTVGGTLMTYGYLKAKQKKVPINIFFYYLHRYLRLTPPLALTVLVSSTLLTYMGSGPKWPLVKLYFQNNCADYWWSTLFYVQNYVNISKMCVGQTWYLSIDMQMYVISPLILTLLWSWPKPTLSLLILSIFGFIGGCFYVAWTNNLTAILSNLHNTSQQDFMNKYYLLTHTRAAPWIIGIILGFIIFKIKQKEMRFKLQTIPAITIWILSLIVLLICILGGHATLRGEEYNRFGNSLHIALVRPVWSLCISWIILACITKHGGPINWLLSLPIYQVLNRFIYSIYLTHVTLLYLKIYGREWPDYFSNFNMIYQFWGTLWVSTGLAVLLVFMVESPMIIIEKYLFSNVGKKHGTKVKDPETGVDNPTCIN